jgi:hypothetical protein|tara:strand:- start:652 stop:867 length:216 start_codon:yes stop_codon:yes gene_type:complete
MEKQMSDWNKEKIMIAELKSDVSYIREDLQIMQKQIRDLNTTSNMGLGGLKVALFIGGILGAIYTFLKIMD